MSLILVLSLQAAAVATPAAPAPSPAAIPGQRWAMPVLIARDGGATPIAFDLERLRTADAATCRGGTAGNILVCGPRRGGNAFPLAYWARVFGPEPPIRAEMDLGGGVQGRIHSEAVPMDRGAVSNRVMVGIRWPF